LDAKQKVLKEEWVIIPVKILNSCDISQDNCYIRYHINTARASSISTLS